MAPSPAGGAARGRGRRPRGAGTAGGRVQLRTAGRGVLADTLAPPSVRESIGDYQPGSKEDFDRLYRELYPRLLRTLYGVLGDGAAAEDCVQEAFERAFRAWPRFRPERPAEAWVHQIAINVAISYQRRARLRQVGELLRRLGRPAERQPPPDRDLLQALSSLPAAQSAAFVLRHYHGYSNREVARLLGVSERTVGSRLAAARTSLARALGSEWGLPTRPPSSVAMDGPDV